MANKPVYTVDQIHLYYDYVRLPASYRYVPGAESRAVARGPQGLEYLAALQRYTLVNIPFENLSLHYARAKAIDLHAELVFEKILTRNAGRGGYCMETNLLFATVLRTLGFEVYSTSGRVSTGASINGDVLYTGFAHHLNIVTIQGFRYSVDVGYGGGNPTRPLPLEDGKVHLNMRPSQELRLRFDAIAETERSNKLWIFERRNRPEDPWTPQYCFSDSFECTPVDFESMNYFWSTNPTSFFTWKILVVKYIFSEDGGEIVGESILEANKMFRRILGKKEFEVELKTEQERVDVLEQEFGIMLSEHERSSILGMASCLPK